MKISKLFAIFISLLLSLTLASTNQVYASDKDFIWVAKRSSPFSATERQKLAQYHIVVIENYHNDASIQAVMEEARALTAINPNIKVFPYISLAKLRGIAKQTMINYGFSDAWYLRDANHQKIAAHGYGSNYGTIVGYFIDNSNPDFRQWLVNTFAQWMNEAPFAGVAFDEVEDLTEFTQDQEAINTLTPAQIAAWNQGQKTLIAQTRARLPDHLIIFNKSVADQRLNYQNIADLALNENFCFDKKTQNLFPKNELLSQLEHQINLSQNNLGLLQKVNTLNSPNGDQPSPSQQVKLARFCAGLFLMGWQPNQSYFKYGYNYDQSSGEIDYNAPELTLNLGSPNSPHRALTNGLLKREFANGFVYLNLDPIPKNVPAPTTLVLNNTGSPKTTYNTNEIINIPANEAYFLLKSSSALPGDLNGDGRVNLADYNKLVSGYGTTYNLSHYNQLLTNYGK